MNKDTDKFLIPLCMVLFTVAFTLLTLGVKSLLPLSAKTVSSVSGGDTFSSGATYRREDARQIQQNIAAQVIRLHVIANSDSGKDQSLKLQVRDDVIDRLQSCLSSARSVEEARNVLLSQISYIEDTANETVAREGYSYPVKVSLQTRYFPVKVYGDLRFPAGNYQALCLEIGASQGHNWWCVLYPSLCFVNETYAVVPEKSKKKLKQSLSTEEYSSLEVHSALYDWMKKKTLSTQKSKKHKKNRN
jgi:stage II sporulation protein R